MIGTCMYECRLCGKNKNDVKRSYTAEDEEEPCQRSVAQAIQDTCAQTVGESDTFAGG